MWIFCFVVRFEICVGIFDTSCIRERPILVYTKPKFSLLLNRRLLQTVFLSDICVDIRSNIDWLEELVPLSNNNGINNTEGIMTFFIIELNCVFPVYFISFYNEEWCSHDRDIQYISNWLLWRLNRRWKPICYCTP